MAQNRLKWLFLSNYLIGEISGHNYGLIGKSSVSMGLDTPPDPCQSGKISHFAGRWNFDKIVSEFLFLSYNIALRTVCTCAHHISVFRRHRCIQREPSVSDKDYDGFAYTLRPAWKCEQKSVVWGEGKV